MTTIFNCCNLSVFNYLVMIMTAKQLDQIDVKAIKTCNGITFWTDKKDGEITLAKMRLFKEVKNDPWQKEAVYEIDVSARVSSYCGSTDNSHCSHYEPRYEFSDFCSLNAFCQTVKKGDFIELVWMGEQYRHSSFAGIEYDLLIAVIVRGDQRFPFTIAKKVCVNESNYRMIPIKRREATANV